ncbi:MAG: VWA domain-containing protein [Desulfobaccales bacterium]
MNFAGFIGHRDAKLAIILNLIDPRIGGVVLAGEKGAGKSTLARLSRHLLSGETPFVEGPLNLTAEALLGGVDFEEALKSGEKRLAPGLLSRAHHGVLFLDDVNLLPPDILTLILEAKERQLNVVAREGLSFCHAARFTLLATLNPDEGQLSPHALDRFGFWVPFAAMTGAPARIKIIKHNLAGPHSDSRSRRWDNFLAGKILQARETLSHVALPDETLEYISRVCLAARVSGHRADLVLQRGAQAYAAFRGDPEARPFHVEKVMPLALAHRLRQPFEPHHAEPQREQGQSDPRPEDRQEPLNHGSQTPESSSQDHEQTWPDLPWLPGLLAPEDQVFDVGEVFSLRRLSCRKDRLERLASGRRTSTRYAGKGGKYVKSIQRKKEHDLALDATIRAAAPWQVLRGRRRRILIHDEDLRFKQRERKMGHLVLFVLDCSGSMGAQKRMIATKGAIMSLLLDCYQKRDKVALIVFRKQQAEVALPPTASVELASRRLQELPVGGKTPLAAGLLAAYRLMRQVSLKDPRRRFLVIIISDGRANQGLSEMPPAEEMESLARLLREFYQADFLVIDTEDKTNPLRADLAVKLAAHLKAEHFTTENLRSEYLAAMVQERLDLAPACALEATAV